MDAQEYLNAISELNPVGPYLRWEKAYDEIQEARRWEEDTSDDDVWRRESKQADWDQVNELGTRILLEQSKDLQIAAYVAEAWAHQRGLVGICDGLDLLQALQDAFWEQIHPESGDLELRRAVYEFLDDPKLLPLRIRSTELTRVEAAPLSSYSYVRYKEALETDQRFQRAKNEKERSLLQGQLRGAEVDAASAQTPRAFYVNLVEQLQGCRATVERFNQDLSTRWPATPRDPPPQLSETLTALEEVEREAKKLLGRKPAPPPKPEPPAPEAPRAAPEDELTPVDDAPASEQTSDESVPEAAPSPQRDRRNAPLSLPASTDDAVARIVEAAHYLRRTDPANPAPYVVLRGLQFGAFYREADALASGNLAAPTTEVRQRLHQMSREPDGYRSAELLDESEQALARLDGCGWLDPHFYSARALATLGFTEAARACTAILAVCLRDFGRWPACYLRDGTPCASQATRDWIEGELRERYSLPALAGRNGSEALVEHGAHNDAEVNQAGRVDGKAESPDPWLEAQALARSGRLDEATAVMVRALRQARTGRERFLRMLQQAELFLNSDRAGLALPLLELLAQRIDEFRLDQWEDSSLCARVLAHLYRCLAAKDGARAAAVYNRLCQIDASEALLLRET
jgi:type VI secretion system ImpA family protein